MFDVEREVDKWAAEFEAEWRFEDGATLATFSPFTTHSISEGTRYHVSAADLRRLELMKASRDYRAKSIMALYLREVLRTMFITGAALQQYFSEELGHAKPEQVLDVDLIVRGRYAMTCELAYYLQQPVNRIRLTLAAPEAFSSDTAPDGKTTFVVVGFGCELKAPQANWQAASLPVALPLEEKRRVDRVRKPGRGLVKSGETIFGQYNGPLGRCLLEVIHKSHSLGDVTFGDVVSVRQDMLDDDVMQLLTQFSSAES